MDGGSGLAGAAWPETEHLVLTQAQSDGRPLRAPAGDLHKAQHVAVEPDRALKVLDFQYQLQQPSRFHFSKCRGEGFGNASGVPGHNRGVAGAACCEETVTWACAATSTSPTSETRSG